MGERENKLDREETHKYRRNQVILEECGEKLLMASVLMAKTPSFFSNEDLKSPE